MTDINTFGMTPGTTVPVSTLEAQIFLNTGGGKNPWPSTAFLGSSAVDAGNTPTTFLRPGLVLGQKASDGLLYPYLATASDGTEIAVAILSEGVSTLDNTGVAVSKQCRILMAGAIRAANCIGAGQAGGLDLNARQLLIAGGRFFFDDDNASLPSFLGHAAHEVAKTAAYTVVAADNGTEFTTTGATGTVAFTLPAIASASGLTFKFRNTAVQTMSVASAEGTNIVCDGSIAASSLTFSTASHKQGCIVVRANAAQTLWYVENLSAAAAVITVA